VICGGWPAEIAHFQLDIARLIVKGVELEDPFSQEAYMPTRLIRGNSDLLSWLLEETQSVYRKKNLETRVQAAIEICSLPAQPNVASLIRGLLNNHPITPAICHVKCESGRSRRRTLLHCVSWNLGGMFRLYGQTYDYIVKRCSELIVPITSQACKDPISRLLILASELVAAGSDIHTTLSTRDEDGKTLLASIFCGYMDRYCDTRFHDMSGILLLPEVLITLRYPSNVLTPIYLWLTVLANSGIDLLEYGRKEKLTYNCEYPSIYSPVWGHRSWPRRKVFSFTFSYGSRPQDWRFWLILTMDNSFREFWDMVDHPERAMPDYWDDNQLEEESDMAY
jgi:hypothetical protein